MEERDRGRSCNLIEKAALPLSPATAPLFAHGGQRVAVSRRTRPKILLEEAHFDHVGGIGRSVSLDLSPRVDYWPLQLSSNFVVRSVSRVAKFPAARPSAKGINSPSNPATQGEI